MSLKNEAIQFNTEGCIRMNEFKKTITEKRGIYLIIFSKIAILEK